jgi:hypothetical protein
MIPITEITDSKNLVKADINIEDFISELTLVKNIVYSAILV